MTPASVVLHGHFYQPPREDPWTDRQLREPSAAPYHDWNERILAECYRPVTHARVLDDKGAIRDIVNSLEWMSFDAGPTLLRWLRQRAPETYRAFLVADARSRGRLGYGNALAAPYHHVILPLASRRDKVTEVRWGIADFKRRFGREPDGMWLPETAVDTETLEVLADEGIRFTILAPRQLTSPPADGVGGRVRLAANKSIAVFAYDAELSHGVAFGELLASADHWTLRVTEAASSPERRLVSMAVDGETFGHHHHFADMALAATLVKLGEDRRVRVENFASFLARGPDLEAVTIVEPSSWSCAHGVDRWRKDCGCKMDPFTPSQQAWREVLRDALEELAGDVHRLFETEGATLLDDPWAARDAYGAVLDAGEAERRRFVRERGRESASEEDTRRALELLEMERDALRMFTSCGWFFDDIAGLEPLQVLRYAAHALDLSGDPGGAWEKRLRTRLAGAESNDPKAGDARRLWDERIRAKKAAEKPRPPAEIGGDLLATVRQFLRAPGEEAGKALAAAVGAHPDRSSVELLAAQSLFARGIEHGLGEPSPVVEAAALRLGFGPSFFRPRVFGGRGPVNLVFGLHLHQPLGNFDHVFQSHTDEVYLPLLRRLAERNLLPITLHVSGPLLEWMEAHAHDFLDLVGRLVSEKKVEMLLSGFYEPVLPALSRQERVEQIGWMREWLARRFGASAEGIWLTERVWEPDLVCDLVQAGVRYAFVDDRHFLVAGFDRRELHRPHRTESGGDTLALLPIDEKLRYLVPFRPPAETEAYLRSLAADDQPLAVIADDAEKFGGWPGTAEWVWGSGWLEHFLDTMESLSEAGVVRLARAHDAVECVPARGPSYLPSASYREMETWALPPAAALDLESLADRLETEGVPQGVRRFVRGGHWRSFFAIYSESNRMHRKVQALSDLCRRRGDPQRARRAIGGAQCNDAYWHGVFGGLYLRHLREAIWANLAEAEELLRKGEKLGFETADLDGDGQPEIWIHSSRFSCVVSPARGGAVTELTRFAERRNLADVLTRRWESYHGSGPHETEAPAGGAPSIHELEEALSFGELPPFDPGERTLTAERVLGGALTRDRYARADYDAVRSWMDAAAEFEARALEGAVEIDLRLEAPEPLSKKIRLMEDGSLEIRYRWDPATFPPDAWFAPELSLAGEVDLSLDPPTSDVWRYEIRSVSKSERGPEESLQGWSVTPRWRCSLGEAGLRIGAAPGTKA